MVTIVLTPFGFFHELAPRKPIPDLRFYSAWDVLTTDYPEPAPVERAKFARQEERRQRRPGGDQPRRGTRGQSGV